jgi:flagellar export protein FliJ
MAFKFPLATVLRLRESIEKREELTMQTIQLELARLRQTIDAVSNDIEQRAQKLQKRIERTVEASELQLDLAEIERSVEMRKTLLKEVEVAKNRHKEQSKVYRAAARARQTLTEMQSECRAAYEQKQERIQQKFLDDIFVSRSRTR